MKNTLLSLFYLLSVCFVNAQTKTISIGSQLDIPANFGKASKLGLGASAEGVFNFSETSALRLYAGYSSFKGKFFDNKVSFVPIRAGYQFFLAPKQLYIYGEGGPAFFGGDNDPQTHLSLAFGGGSYFTAGNNGIINFSVFFTYTDAGIYKSYTWLTGRIAYGIHWGGNKKNKTKEY